MITKVSILRSRKNGRQPFGFVKCCELPRDLLKLKLLVKRCRFFSQEILKTLVEKQSMIRSLYKSTNEKNGQMVGRPKKGLNINIREKT